MSAQSFAGSVATVVLGGVSRACEMNLSDAPLTQESVLTISLADGTEGSARASWASIGNPAMPCVGLRDLVVDAAINLLENALKGAKARADEVRRYRPTDPLEQLPEPVIDSPFLY